MSTGVRTRYHVGINGKGFMLRGAPMQPRYVKSNAQSLLRSFRIQNEAGIVDIGYNAFTGSGWNYWSQTDWAGGFQNIKFADDGSFKDGQAIEAIKKYGQITIQPGWTSAAQISGSHSYGAHGVHGLDLLFGTVKSGAAKVFKLTSANTISTLSAFTGISAVNSVSRFKNDSLIGLTRTSGTLNTLVKYNGTAVVAVRSANPIVRAVKGIGIRAYTGERVTSLSGDVLYYSTDLSTFTSAYQAGKNRNIKIVDEVNGQPYFFVVEGKRVELFRWDEFAERAYPIYTWENLTSFGTKKYLSFLCITGSSNGMSVAFAFNGARVWEIFDDQLRDSSYDFSHPFEFEGHLQTKGATWDQNYWFPGIYGKLSGTVVTPFENFSNKAYGFASVGTKIFLGYRDTMKYAVSGYVESSEYGAIIGGVDKIVNSVAINHRALATGETIEIFRSVDAGSSFSSVGKASYTVDGAISNKIMYFPSGFVTKLWEYKATLCGPGTTTPTLLDITHQYRPEPDLKKTWQLSIDAGDDIVLLNKEHEQRDGKALIQDLWNELETKDVVTYEDVDAFEVQIVSAMTAANTSARVSNTRLMPPRGRLRVLKSNVIEQMIYTSADGGIVKGLTRGWNHTLPRAYTSADKMDNYYNVFVTDMKEQVNDTDQKTTESIANVTILEV